MPADFERGTTHCDSLASMQRSVEGDMIGDVRYQRVVWRHDHDDEPVVLWSEVGDDGYERRKVDEYRDGRLDWADDTVRTGTTMLGDQRVPPLEETDAEDEFAAVAISPQEFQAMWERARS